MAFNLRRIRRLATQTTAIGFHLMNQTGAFGSIFALWARLKLNVPSRPPPPALSRRSLSSASVPPILAHFISASCETYASLTRARYRKLQRSARFVRRIGAKRTTDARVDEARETEGQTLSRSEISLRTNVGPFPAKAPRKLQRSGRRERKGGSLKILRLTPGNPLKSAACRAPGGVPGRGRVMAAGGRKGEGTAPVSAPYRYGVQVSGKVSGSAIIRITCLPGTLACCHPDLRVGRGGERGGGAKDVFASWRTRHRLPSVICLTFHARTAGILVAITLLSARAGSPASVETRNAKRRPPLGPEEGPRRQRGGLYPPRVADFSRSSEAMPESRLKCA